MTREEIKYKMKMLVDTNFPLWKYIEDNDMNHDTYQITYAYYLCIRLDELQVIKEAFGDQLNVLNTLVSSGSNNIHHNEPFIRLVFNVESIQKPDIIIKDSKPKSMKLDFTDRLILVFVIILAIILLVNQ